jgi:hypothetical protein
MGWAFFVVEGNAPASSTKNASEKSGAFCL